MALIEGLSVLVLSLAAMPLAGQSLPGGSALGFRSGGQDRLVLSGNVHRAVRDLVPLDRTDPGLPMERMILSFRMRPEAKVQLEQLLIDQQDPGSPSFHQWLTPEGFAARFGPSQDEIAKVSGWLRDQGFTIDEVARGGMAIHFSGDVGGVERAFRTPIMDYLVQGVKRHANAADPSIPVELAPLVAGVVSLHNIPRKAANTGFRPLTPAENARLAGSAPQYNSLDGNHYLAPGDFATIYDVNPLYSAGVDGTGVTIAIVGRTNPGTANWAAFRNKMGLPVNTPAILIPNGAGSKDMGSAEDGEADLDAEWSGAVARNASIVFVCWNNTNTSDGADLSAQYIVTNALAPVMSSSFSGCEASLGATGNTFYNNLWQQAAGEGISVFVASGDSGAAGCDLDTSKTATMGTGVNGLASTPYNTCVGGTQFNEGSGSYWAASNSGTLSSVLSYIPEVAWNESSSTGQGAGLWSSGGGASVVYPKPSWQVAPGVPGADVRYVPDVSLAAAGHDGYLVYTTGAQGTGLYAVSGTSASTPSFAGLMALVVQKAGQNQGNANPALYKLGNDQYNGSGSVFHDILSGTNTVPGVTGFNAGVGYDEVTGLGSVDAFALVNTWVGKVTTPVSAVGLLAGKSAVFTAQVTGATSPNLTWSTTGGATITPAAAPSTSATFSAPGAGTYTVTATSAAAPALFATITVQVHGPDLIGTGTSVTGLDVLDVLGHYGSSGAAADVDGDGVVGQADLSIMLNLLGWN